MKNFFSFFTLLFCFSITFITCKEENFNDGTFCDNAPDANCGGLGRIAKVFKANIPQPDNFYYFTDIIEIGLSVLPPNYYVIDVRFAKFDEHFGGPAGHHWYITLRVGKAVQCCDCCC